jgi:hypothetical protein
MILFVNKKLMIEIKKKMLFLKLQAFDIKTSKYG